MQPSRSQPGLSFVCLFVLAQPPAALAQLPLTIEALLVSDKRLTASLSGSRSSNHEPRLLASDQGLALAWREAVVERSALGLRYGVSPRLELNARFERSRLAWEVGGRVAGTERGDSMTLGANWLAARGAAGSLLLDARVTALDRPLAARGGWRTAAAADIGATWYRALDPVVLSLAMRYRRERSRTVAAGTLRPGQLLSAEAGVNFAVNDRVTLLGGFAMQRREPDRLAGLPTRGTSLRTSMDAGLALAPWAGATLFLRGRLPLDTADGGGSLALELLQEF